MIAFSKLYLASQSLQREVLLNQIGITFETLLPGAEENAEALEAVLPYETAVTYVQRVSHLKAQMAATRRSQRQLDCLPILSADTVVALEGAILGKPSNAQDAQAMLQCLSGTRHEVLTSVCLICPDGNYHSVLSISNVCFRILQIAEIQRYIDSGESFGKAGGYAIQGRAIEFIEHISGSYSGIMGLPLFETAALLRQFINF